MGFYTITNDMMVLTSEVSQIMFEEIMGYDSLQNQITNDSSGSFGVGPNNPAYYVSWHMAADFTNQFTILYNQIYQSTLQECFSCQDLMTPQVECSFTMDPYQCDGFRLPTEAEWEYFTHSGSTNDLWTIHGDSSIPGSTQCFGQYNTSTTPAEPIANYIWYCGIPNSTVYGSQSIAQLTPNGFGLYDTQGNVWEWTSDWWGCNLTGQNPSCVQSGSNKVFKGGSWKNPAYRVNTRSSYPPDERNYLIGFRLLRTY